MNKEKLKRQLAYYRSTLNWAAMPVYLYYDRSRTGKLIKKPVMDPWHNLSARQLNLKQPSTVPVMNSEGRRDRKHHNAIAIRHDYSKTVNLDVDIKGADGAQYLKTNFPELPLDTPEIITPSGGRHYLFLVDEKLERFVTKRSDTKHGIDLMLGANLEFVPGSEVADLYGYNNNTDGKYDWIKRIDKDKGNLRPMSDELVEAITSHFSKEGTVKIITDEDAAKIKSRLKDWQEKVGLPSPTETQVEILETAFDFLERMISKGGDRSTAEYIIIYWSYVCGMFNYDKIYKTLYNYNGSKTQERKQKWFNLVATKALINYEDAQAAYITALWRQNV